MRLYAVRDCGLLTCLPTPKFERGRMLELPLKPLLYTAFVVRSLFFFIFICEQQHYLSQDLFRHICEHQPFVPTENFYLLLFLTFHL
jgi:hypothetical protein